MCGLVRCLAPSSFTCERSEDIWLFWWLVNLSRCTKLNSRDILITGDFNLHLDVPDNPDVRRFNNLLDVHGLKQHVSEPTHMLGHILDLFIARDSSRLLCDAVVVVDPGLTDPSGNYFGDHFALVAPLNFTKPSRQRKTVTFRKYASINLTDQNGHTDGIKNLPNLRRRCVSCRIIYTRV